MAIEVGEPHIPKHGSLLEGVTYDPRTDALYYIDIRRGLLHIHPQASVKASSTPRAIQVSKTLGVIGLTTDVNVLIAGGHDGVYLVDLTTEKVSEFAIYPNGNVVNGIPLRSNDGSVAPDGTLWVGTMSATKNKDFVGQMWHLGSNGDLKLLWDKTAVPNGLNWDLIRGKMYWTESKEHRIYSYDWDVQTNQPDYASKKVFYENTTGCDPDGSCLDSEGNLYIAIYGEGKVYRVNPLGQTDLSFDLPAKNISCVTLGGKNLDQLFITSGIQTGDVKDANDLGGALFKVDLAKYNVKGVPKNLFKLK